MDRKFSTIQAFYQTFDDPIMSFQLTELVLHTIADYMYFSLTDAYDGVSAVGRTAAEPGGGHLAVVAAGSLGALVVLPIH